MSDEMNASAGEMLQEWLDDHIMDAESIAARTDLTEDDVEDILSGDSVSDDVAYQLEIATGSSR